ncbi:DNA/RNA non-specific endonuclease [Flavobacteriaceae bacterium R38]|nr:DNA/RNA non-specific endonuclease [Flavobacteriaceae bacterium R38]
MFSEQPSLRSEEPENTTEKTNTFYLPTSTTNQVVHHNYYSLSYNEVYEQAEWVAYELKKSDISSINRKRPYFEVDPLVKTKSAHWRNYKNSGYDRGHFCPAGDRKFSIEAYNQTFYTSNISPQKHSFNSGVWNRLEQMVRRWAKRYDGVFVVTGGVLNSNLKTIGGEEVAVPDYFYKVILDNRKGDYKLIAFLVPHKETKEDLRNFVVPVDELEKLTGIDFFPELPDAIENKEEASKGIRNWKF